MKVTIYGSGYVGLVTGACLAQVGNDVLCVDIDPRKIDMLKRNNRVCFGADVGREYFQSETGTSCGHSMRFRSVVGSGRIAFVTDPAEKAEALSLITDHYAPGTYRFSEQRVARTTVLRLDVEEITGKQRP